MSVNINFSFSLKDLGSVQEARKRFDKASLIYDQVTPLCVFANHFLLLMMLFTGN